VHFAHHQDPLVAPREHTESLRDRLVLLADFEAVLRIVLVEHQGAVVVLRYGAQALAAAERVHCEVASNAVEPALETRAGLERVDAGDGPCHGLLANVFGVLTIAREVTAESIETFGVSAHQNFERGVVSVPVPMHELGIG
jgi:hypothetical protein